MGHKALHFTSAVNVCIGWGILHNFLRFYWKVYVKSVALTVCYGRSAKPGKARSMQNLHVQ